VPPERIAEGEPGADQNARSENLVSKRLLVLGGLIVVAAGGYAVASRYGYNPVAALAAWNPFAATAQSKQQQQQKGPAQRVVAVEVATAVKKSTPVQIEALGTVTPMASVAIKSRLDTEILEVHFADGARVKQGDLLLTLDGRGLEAQILQAEGNIAKDKAQIEGNERDIRRYTELVAKNATPVKNLDDAKTQAAVFAATLKSNEAMLKNLHVQLSFTQIRAPISGRISAATVKAGNFVRSADLMPIATIIQTAPVYVTFPMPQVQLPALREALAEGTSSVDVVIPGETKKAVGRIAMVENTVDPATGMVAVRAGMPNQDELLWPGTLVQTFVKLRTEDAVTVPSAAVQVSQTGNYVYVIKDEKAELRPVKVARTLGDVAVIESGVADGEAVVVDGHLQLANGSRVAIRATKKPVS
jgi:membrane fusion protein, multidrug efflux system